jgi:hypothetical protein
MSRKEYTNEEVIQYHSLKYSIPLEKINQLFKELIDFLNACSVSVTNKRPTREVDKLWHSFILHTEAYTQYCARYYGKYIHHRPDPVTKLKMAGGHADCQDGSDAEGLFADCDAGGSARNNADCSAVK